MPSFDITNENEKKTNQKGYQVSHCNTFGPYEEEHIGEVVL
jgi:hypothetical protein